MKRQSPFPIQPILLAGGKSSRMGENKSFVLLDGVPLVEVVLRKISPLFSLPPIVVTNSPELYSYLGLEMTRDIITGRGPLGGIHAALTYSKEEYNFIFACDMPFLQGDLIQYMIDDFQGEDVLMPNYNGVQPLHAIYGKKCLPFIEQQLQQGYGKIIAFLSEVKVRYLEITQLLGVPEAEKSFININNSEELAKARLWQQECRKTEALLGKEKS